jgi:hypothetical protein
MYKKNPTTNRMIDSRGNFPQPRRRKQNDERVTMGVDDEKIKNTKNNSPCLTLPYK